MMLSVFLIFALFSAVTAFNATLTSPEGFVCNYGDALCKASPKFDAKVIAALQAMKGMLKIGKPNMALALTNTNVCSSVVPYIPTEYCSCTNDSGGATVDCTIPVTYGGENLDTIYVTVTLEVCANPATIGFTIQDGDTGHTFSTSLSSGDSGSIPTGIEFGVPGIGNVQVNKKINL